MPDKSNKEGKIFNTGEFRAYSRYYYRPNIMSFEIKNLEPGQTYKVEVYAYDDFENKSKEPLVGTIKTNSKEIIVNKIKNLVATSSKNEVKLTWDVHSTSEGLTEYIIYKDGKEYTRVPVGTTEVVVENLRINTNYGFKVVAKYSNGKESKPVSVNVRTKKNNS